jgi:hypothetical protein
MDFITDLGIYTKKHKISSGRHSVIYKYYRKNASIEEEKGKSYP